MTIKPIETVYNGYKFRSRLEARWAVFFDALRMKYDYEPEGFDMDGIWYLPDFWLPDQNLWVEIKGEDPDPGEIDKAKRLCLTCKEPIVGVIVPKYSAVIILSGGLSDFSATYFIATQKPDAAQVADFIKSLAYYLWFYEDQPEKSSQKTTEKILNIARKSYPEYFKDRQPYLDENDLWCGLYLSEDYQVVTYKFDNSIAFRFDSSYVSKLEKEQRYFKEFESVIDGYLRRDNSSWIHSKMFPQVYQAAFDAARQARFEHGESG